MRLKIKSWNCSEEYQFPNGKMKPVDKMSMTELKSVVCGIAQEQRQNRERKAFDKAQLELPFDDDIPF